MNEKRQFPRYECNISVKFAFYEGNPEELKMESLKPVKGKGTIIDISKGGAFIVCNSRVNINMPINLFFSASDKKNILNGIIVIRDYPPISSYKGIKIISLSEVKTL